MNIVNIEETHKITVIDTMLRLFENFSLKVNFSEADGELFIKMVEDIKYLVENNIN